MVKSIDRDRTLFERVFRPTIVSGIHTSNCYLLSISILGTRVENQETRNFTHSDAVRVSQYWGTRRGRGEYQYVVGLLRSGS